MYVNIEFSCIAAGYITHLKMVRLFLNVLFKLLGKERDGVTDEQVSNVLSQQIVQPLVLE